MEMSVLNLIDKVVQTGHLDKTEIVELLQSDKMTQLTDAADAVRKKYVGDVVHLRGLIEFSNYCKQNCCYCGLRRDNREVERYRFSVEDIINEARLAKKLGYRTIVMQSGEDVSFSVDKMTAILRQIKALDVAITLSIGEKTYEEYKAYKEAGADRYLLRIETTNQDLYHKLNPGMRFQDRIRCLEDLQTLGYEVGSGCLIGLPEQTIESIAEDILFFQQFPMDMVGLGPFIPNPSTPLAACACGNLELSLKVIALIRLFMPDINIPATTAMETLDKSARFRALKGGANVIMPNVTSLAYRKKYQLYPGKSGVDDTPEKSKAIISAKVLAIDRSISMGYGFRKRKNDEIKPEE